MPSPTATSPVPVSCCSQLQLPHLSPLPDLSVRLDSNLSPFNSASDLLLSQSAHIPQLDLTSNVVLYSNCSSTQSIDTANMSQSHALSDDQVAGELRKMTAFIRQEALEKAREIQIKADEEFAIEKSKLVRQETASIDLQYEKKFKQASMSQQITRSTLANRTRLRVLSSRQELLDDLFQRARDKITNVASADSKKYEAILKDLVLEGLYLLNEEKIEVRGRKKDYDTIKQAMQDASAEFKDNVGREVSVVLDEADPLPDGS